MNPLKFVKLCRQRQNAAQHAMEMAVKMSNEELQEMCVQRGYSPAGNRDELIGRVRSCLKRQSELIGNLIFLSLHALY